MYGNTTRWFDQEYMIWGWVKINLLGLQLLSSGYLLSLKNRGKWRDSWFELHIGLGSFSLVWCGHCSNAWEKKT